LIKGSKNHHYQVMSRDSLSAMGAKKFGTQIIKTLLTNIYFGVVKESRRREKNTCQHREAISWKLSGQKFLFEDGHQSGVDLQPLKMEQTLLLIIN
jgi:hypothetical protein